MKRQKISLRHCILLLVFSIFINNILVSCGYQPGVGPLRGSCRTVTVPYVCGDRDGIFTSELIRQLAVSGAYRYTDSNPDLILKVALVDRDDESIGYRYETNPSGVMGQRLVASEDRAMLIAEVCLIEARACKTILGPTCLKTCVDFDFIPETSAQIFGPPASPQTLTRFSLGQLDFREAAADAVKVPLYRQMAKQIVDYISECW